MQCRKELLVHDPAKVIRQQLANLFAFVRREEVIDAAEGKSWPMRSIERFAFYERAKSAYCIIQTGERRFYGCFAFRKGVVPPEAG